MARKSLIACNGCGALEEVDGGGLTNRPPDGWFLIDTTWPRTGHQVVGDKEEWVICSPKCFTTLADITAERQAEREATT